MAMHEPVLGHERAATDGDGDSDIAALMVRIGRRAKDAAASLSLASTDIKNAALVEAAAALRADTTTIKAANATDLATARERGLSAAMMDRLRLDDSRIEAMAAGLEAIAALPDPVGQTVAEWAQPNGLRIARVRVPLGVIGIIYESRPNVTADAGALCLKAGNAAILRGGSESFHSAHAIFDCLRGGMIAAGLPAGAIQMVPTRDRAAVGAMLGLDEFIDIIVPRGGKSLVARVHEESRIPVLAHLDGNCHVYIERGADLAMARSVALNAKMRRTGICGAAETLLIDERVAPTYLPLILDDLAASGCEIRGDQRVQVLYPQARSAAEADWDTEFLDAVIAVRVVAGLDEAIAHIAAHGSHHTDSIVTEDAVVAERFLREVDSAIVMHNASTQYADGGEFGMGAEIGISTGRLHARGPCGLEQLTIYKYVVRGSGQVRP
jgi:glutamate-5-semialdehyde dehydrogenase